MVTEVHEQAQFEASGVEIIQDLGAVFIHEAGNRLQFDDNLIEADKISDKSLLEGMTFVFKPQNSLRNERRSLESEFELQALLKHRLEKSTAFFFIYLKTGTDDFVGSFRIDKVVHVFVYLVCFVGYYCSVERLLDARLRPKIVSKGTLHDQKVPFD
jgi:hypothetical protein